MSKVISLTPAVFHLSEAVNDIARHYGENPIVPRGPRFAPILEQARSKVKSVLGTSSHEPIFMTGTGSTAIAAVLGSCLAPSERLMVIRNGAYGDRIFEYASMLGQRIHDEELAYGVHPNLEKIDGILRRNEVDAVAMVYGGTSTCTLNPLAELGAMCKSYNKKLLVDGVSSLFVEPMDLEGWGISAVMGSCNKGLHSHPNLTMALVHKDLLKQMEQIPPRVPNLELLKTHKAQLNGAHPYTIDPMSLLMVNAALEKLEKDGGVSGRNSIYRERCDVLRPGFESLGLRIARFDRMPLSSIGTAIHIPEHVSYTKMADRLATEEVDGHVFEIYSAQGKLSTTLFRIFHMGDYPVEVYHVFLRALERVLRT